MTNAVDEWRAAGQLVGVKVRRLYVQHREPRGAAGPLLVFLHGFPSSSYDFRELLERLPHRRALLLDFLGFGLSDKPRDQRYSLFWQADAVEELVERAGSPPVVVVAHDMGTSVATELFAREIEGRARLAIEAALLFNGSILLDRASPTIGQKLLRSPLGAGFARLNTERSFRVQFGRIFSPAHPLTREQAADQWALLSHNHGQQLLHRTISYMDERERLTDRWHGAYRDWPGRLSLAWGLRDPVATPAVLDGLRELRPHASVRELPELGHYPQIEDPDAVAQAVEAAAG